MSTKIFILTNIVGQTSKYDIQNGCRGHFESGHRVKYSSNHQTNIKYEFLVLNNPSTPILSSIVSQLKTTNIFKMAAATILNLDKGLTRFIRDSETSIEFVQGPPGSRRERVKY